MPTAVMLPCSERHKPICPNDAPPKPNNDCNIVYGTNYGQLMPIAASKEGQLPNEAETQNRGKPKWGKWGRTFLSVIQQHPAASMHSGPIFKGEMRRTDATAYGDLATLLNVSKNLSKGCEFIEQCSKLSKNRPGTYTTPFTVIRRLAPCPPRRAFTS